MVLGWEKDTFFPINTSVIIGGDLNFGVAPKAGDGV